MAAGADRLVRCPDRGTRRGGTSRGRAVYSSRKGPRRRGRAGGAAGDGRRQRVPHAEGPRLPRRARGPLRRGGRTCAGRGGRGRPQGAGRRAGVRAEGLGPRTLAGPRGRGRGRGPVRITAVRGRAVRRGVRGRDLVVTVSGTARGAVRPITVTPGPSAMPGCLSRRAIWYSGPIWHAGPPVTPGCLSRGPTWHSGPSATPAHLAQRAP